MPWGSSHLRCSQGMAFMDSNLCAASPLFRPVSRFSALPGLYRKREKGMCDVLLRSLIGEALMLRAHRGSFCGEYTRNVLTFTSSQNGSEESKPIGHKNCVNTPPSHKHTTIKSTI